MHGPKALAPSKSLPLAGPSPPAISIACASRALKSLKIVNPKMCWRARDAGMSRPPAPITQASSHS